MIAIIDNYDSFTYNLYQYIGEINPDIQVFRNDKITPEELLNMQPSHIILSPGPGHPKDAGACLAIIKANKHIPLLGVCLGHQAIGQAFGSTVVNAPKIMHGKQDVVKINPNIAIFRGLDSEIQVGRYHSLIVGKKDRIEPLSIIAESIDGEIMGVMHEQRPIYGIQFHPESILTPCGKIIIKNFLEVRA